LDLIGFTILIAVLSSIVIVPFIWVKLRGEKSGYPEGRYPDPSVKPLSIDDYGDFEEDKLPTAEFPVYGRSKSTPGYRQAYLAQREWVHPDFYQFRKSLEKMRIKAEKETSKE
jgi:hypothetical protein